MIAFCFYSSFLVSQTFGNWDCKYRFRWQVGSESISWNYKHLNYWYEYQPSCPSMENLNQANFLTLHRLFPSKYTPPICENLTPAKHDAIDGASELNIVKCSDVASWCLSNNLYYWRNVELKLKSDVRTATLLLKSNKSHVNLTISITITFSCQANKPHLTEAYKAFDTL